MRGRILYSSITVLSIAGLDFNLVLKGRGQSRSVGKDATTILKQRHNKYGNIFWGTTASSGTAAHKASSIVSRGDGVVVLRRHEMDIQTS